jgi:hypothetical protein
VARQVVAVSEGRFNSAFNHFEETKSAEVTGSFVIRLFQNRFSWWNSLPFGSTFSGG